MDNYNRGFVIDTAKMNKSEYQRAAHDWAEGSKELEQLLLYCLENGIKTQSCCIGHKESDRSFIQFEFSHKQLSPMLSLINRYIDNDEVFIILLNNPGLICKVAFYFPQELREYFFVDMLNSLKRKEKVDISSMDSYMADIVSIILNDDDLGLVEFFLEGGGKDKTIGFSTDFEPYCKIIARNTDEKFHKGETIDVEQSAHKMIPIIKKIKLKSDKITAKKERKEKKATGDLKNSTVQQKESMFVPEIFFSDSEFLKSNPDLICLEALSEIVLMSIWLINYKKEGKMAFGFCNGIALDNFTYDNAEDIRNYYRKILKQAYDSRRSYEPLSEDDIKRLFSIKESRILGRPLSEESLEFEKQCAGRYELDPSGQILVVLDRYYLAKKKEIEQNRSLAADITYEYNDEMYNPNFRALRVDVSDSPEIVAKKLDIARAHGVYAYAIINGIEMDNCNELSSVEILEKYAEKKSRIENGIDSNPAIDLTPEVKSRLSKIEIKRSKGQYISEEESFFCSTLVESLELVPDTFSQTMVAFNNYSNMISSKKIESAKTI